jgi:hypothetical protein
MNLRCLLRTAYGTGLPPGMTLGVSARQPFQDVTAFGPPAAQAAPGRSLP